MANLYNQPATCSSSSFPPETTDDISMFLRQILLKSSSSTSYSSSSIVTKQMQCEIPPLQPVYSSGLSVIDRIPNFFSPTSAYTPTNTVTYEDDPDEYDCESEEGFEDLMEQMAVKSNRHRNPSKRARAAEDHNLSEKRRRSRINEKMKALQKLIPNSNKTDKASMLDEAIEYLKQLQLRLQMLTMRNGMNLYVPPGVLQPQQLPHSRIGLHAPENIASLNQDTRVSPMIRLPIQCTNRNHPSIPELSHISNPGSSSSFRESLMNSNGSVGGQLMNAQQKLVLPVGLDRHCTRNESCDDAKR